MSTSILVPLMLFNCTYPLDAIAAITHVHCWFYFIFFMLLLQIHDSALLVSERSRCALTYHLVTLTLSVGK